MQLLYGVCRNENVLTREQIWNRVLSRSYVAALGEEEQSEVKQQVEAVLKKHASDFYTTTAGPTGEQDVARVLLRTEIFVARRKA